MKKIVISLATMLFTAYIGYCADLSVDSDVQHFKDEQNKIELKGNVKVKYDNINVVSPNANVLLDEKTGEVKNVEFTDNAYSYQVENEKKHEII